MFSPTEEYKFVKDIRETHKKLLDKNMPAKNKPKISNKFVDSLNDLKLELIAEAEVTKLCEILVTAINSNHLSVNRQNKAISILSFLSAAPAFQPIIAATPKIFDVITKLSTINKTIEDSVSLLVAIAKPDNFAEIIASESLIKNLIAILKSPTTEVNIKEQNKIAYLICLMAEHQDFQPQLGKINNLIAGLINFAKNNIISSKFALRALNTLSTCPMYAQQYSETPGLFSNLKDILTSPLSSSDLKQTVLIIFHNFSVIDNAALVMGRVRGLYLSLAVELKKQNNFDDAALIVSLLHKLGTIPQLQDDIPNESKLLFSTFAYCLKNSKSVFASLHFNSTTQENFNFNFNFNFNKVLQYDNAMENPVSSANNSVSIPIIYRKKVSTFVDNIIQLTWSFIKNHPNKDVAVRQAGKVFTHLWPYYNLSSQEQQDLELKYKSFFNVTNSTSQDVALQATLNASMQFFPGYCLSPEILFSLTKLLDIHSVINLEDLNIQVMQHMLGNYLNIAPIRNQLLQLIKDFCSDQLKTNVETDEFDNVIKRLNIILSYSHRSVISSTSVFASLFLQWCTIQSGKLHIAHDHEYKAKIIALHTIELLGRDPQMAPEIFDNLQSQQQSKKRKTDEAELDDLKPLESAFMDTNSTTQQVFSPKSPLQHSTLFKSPDKIKSPDKTQDYYKSWVATFGQPFDDCSVAIKVSTASCTVFHFPDFTKTVELEEPKSEFEFDDESMPDEATAIMLSE